jgi:hypothetical protein
MVEALSPVLLELLACTLEDPKSVALTCQCSKESAFLLEPPPNRRANTALTLLLG